jgi:hypothetical protein
VDRNKVENGDELAEREGENFPFLLGRDNPSIEVNDVREK